MRLNPATNEQKACCTHRPELPRFRVITEWQPWQHRVIVTPLAVSKIVSLLITDQCLLMTFYTSLK